MRKAIRALVLIMALAVSAYAGDMPNGITGDPPPSQATVTGEMQNGVAGEIPNNVTGEIPYNVTTSSVLVALLVALIS